LFGAVNVAKKIFVCILKYLGILKIYLQAFYWLKNGKVILVPIPEYGFA
jgi:hypothetical protein